MLGIPIQLISGSITEVFRQRASADYNSRGNCFNIFNKTFKFLVLTSIIPFSLLFLFGPTIFRFFFGDNWEMAGRISQVMAPLFFFRFVVSPLTYVFFVAHKQKIDLFLHTCMLLGSAVVFFINIILETDVLILLLSYTIFYVFIYCVYFFMSLKYSKANERL
jgi:teichuronic acid exporter